MRTKTTVTPDLKILAVLAASKEMEQYKLPKETKLSYRTVLRTLKPLEDKNKWQIELVRTEPSKKGGKEKKIYAITLAGLLRVLRNAPVDDIEYYRKVISTHPRLLLTFEKWPVFKNAGLEEQALVYLVQGIQDFYAAATLYLIRGVPYLKGLTKTKWKEYIDQLILLRPFMYERDRGRPLDMKFLQVCRKDAKLREFIDQQLAMQEKQYKRLSHDKAEWEKL
jgi:DNA-binding PadR family transcriptional regulator